MKKRYIITGIINVVFLIVFMILYSICGKLCSTLEPQKMAYRWQDDTMNYSQSSLFLPEKYGIAIEDVYMYRVNIDKKLSENSIKAKTQKNPDGTETKYGKLWVDAFSGLGTMSVSNEKTRVDAETVFTGGDFFLFHPYLIKYGSYYSDDDVMKDRVVIDEVLAWQLFGSSNVNGMPIKINGVQFYVAGVVRKDSDKASEAVYGEKPRMYMHYTSAKKISPEVKITCYEVCLPNPVKDIGFTMFKDVVDADENTSAVVENSSRYSLKPILSLISHYELSTVSTKGIVFPYWENAARIVENKAALLYVIMILLLVFPVFTIFYLLHRLVKARKIIAGKLIDGCKNVVSNVKKIRMTKKSA